MFGICESTRGLLLETGASGAWKPYTLVPPVLDTTPKSFREMRSPGYWSRGRWVDIRYRGSDPDARTNTQSCEVRLVTLCWQLR